MKRKILSVGDVVRIESITFNTARAYQYTTDKLEEQKATRIVETGDQLVLAYRRGDESSLMNLLDEFTQAIIDLYYS